MVSINLSFPYPLPPYTLNLHSTMVSINRYPLHSQSAPGSHLHSTMVSINLSLEYIG